MKLGLVIHRYIFRELLSPFFISLAILLFILFMTLLTDITDMVINYRVDFTTILMMVTYKIPSFLKYTIPMAVMIGVLLAFLKMSHDNEIIALKAGGMSIYAMLPSVIAFCMMGCLITGVMSLYGDPWGELSFNALKRNIDTGSITALLKERSFLQNNNRTIYIKKVNTLQNILEGIFIEYQFKSNKAIITAPKGRLVGGSNNMVFYLLLEKGRINRTDIETQVVDADTFDTCQIQLDVNRPSASSGGVKKAKEMKPAELQKLLRSFKKKDEGYFKALTIFHTKFSIPFACFALGILAVPLGIQSKSAKRSFGIGLGVFFFLGYYLIMAAGEVYGKSGRFPPVIGMWAPNIVMGGIGCFLLIQCARERAVDIGRLLPFFGRKLKHGSGSGHPPSFPADT